jgi:hypothetical protein
MKHTAKEYHIWKHKATNKAIGKVVEIKEGDSIDNYVEVELPEPMKKMVNMVREWKKKHVNK